jgi:hypothetical protein
MDASQITELRSWATRLEERAAGDDELRAAAKAILMLVDEVESLQAKAEAVQADTPPPAPEPEQAPAAADPPWEAADDRLSGSFFSRLKRTFGFG